MINQNDEVAEETYEEVERPRTDDVDEDALAYIHAKKKVMQLQRARKERRV